VGTSAKRYGLDVKNDLDLELRLRRIEALLEQKQSVNPDATDSRRNRGDAVPQVTGLALRGVTPGGATIGWNPVPINDLRRYEVSLAEDPAFTVNAQTFNEANTTYIISTLTTTGPAGGTDLFARVRAVNTINQKGPWSVVLNTTTGQVVTGDIATGAVTSETISETDAIEASQVSYDNTTSGLAAIQVQAALDEIDATVDAIQTFTRYQSGYGALPSQNNHTEYTHGLGAEPDLIVIKLKCVTADGDFAVDDVVYIGSGYTIADQDGGVGNDNGGLKPSLITSTVIRVTYTIGNQSGLPIHDKDGSALLRITDASWNINVDAYVYS
jgi:hypothetical protein